ncbi:MAG: CotH kinase family protein [Deltaproteobacteria bacterium]|nr:CotH kinase family protein [Deltaproteobacteria bacterium]MBN2671888.1 CotH kinase family protein [Deltaproteobacteria bacterium]
MVGKGLVEGRKIVILIRFIVFALVIFFGISCSSNSKTAEFDTDSDTTVDGDTSLDSERDEPVVIDHSESGLEFSHERGFYEEAFDLTISHPTADRVAYTMDSSNPMREDKAIIASLPLTIRIDPSDVSNRYLAPGVVVRVMPVDDEPAPEKVSTHTFLFASRVVELSPHNLSPGGEWPEPGLGSSQTNDQWIDYGMDVEVVTNPDYESQIASAMLDIPSVSLVTDLDYLFDQDYGIFVNALMRSDDPDPLKTEEAWERSASLEFLYPDAEGVQANAGVRIRGGVSRNDNNPKHAFKCYFRDMYGADKLHYPLFGSEGAGEFDRLDFRTSGNYSWSFDGTNKNTMNRDVFSRDMQRELGRPYTRSRYYHLYLDGVYWGLFQSQERVDSDHVKSYLGGEKGDVDVVKTTRGDDESTLIIEIADGTEDTWQTLWEMSEQGFADDADYFALEGKDENGERDVSMKPHVDIDNLIDYMLIIFYTANLDAPVSKFFGNKSPNNFYAAINRVTLDQGFVFFAHDNEHTLRIDEDWITVGVSENRVDLNTGGFNDMEVNSAQEFHPQWLHHRLTENALYRERFAERAHELLEDDGLFTPSRATALFDARADEIDLAIIAESARWGDAQESVETSPWGDSVTGPLTKNDHWIPMLERIHEEFFQVRTDIVIDQLQQAGLY